MTEAPPDAGASAGADAGPGSLTRRATSAFGWSFLNTALSRLGTLVVGIVLARVLGPSEFGTYAVAIVALMAVLSFNELGVSLAIVRWQGDPRLIAPTVNTISVAASCVLFAAMYTTATPIATALGDAGAAPILQLMAVSVIFSGAVATPAALLQRDFRQRRRMVIDQIVTWSGAALSLGLALAGFGAWSLAIGRVVGTGLGLVLFAVLSSYDYRFGYDRAVAGRVLRFGLPLAGASVIVFAVGYVEQITVGGILGATALGYYVLAFNLASWPVAMFSHPLRSVAPAAFARLQGDAGRLPASFESILRIVAIVTLPVCLILAATAPEVIEVVYGSAWAPAAPILRFLALIAALRIFFELAYDFLVVLRRTGQLLAVQVVWLVALVPALWYAASEHGLAAVAAGQLLVVVVVVVPLYAWLLRRAGLSSRRLVRATALPVAGSAAAAWLCAAVASRVDSAWVAVLAAGALGLLAVLALALPHRALLRQVAVRSDQVGSAQ